LTNFFGPRTYLILNHLNGTHFTTIRFTTKYSRTKPRRKMRPYCTYFGHSDSSCRQKC